MTRRCQPASAAGSPAIGRSLVQAAAGGWLLAVAVTWAAPVPASDGAYGRLDGDVTLALSAGVSEALPGESLAVRAGALYLQSAGIFLQYDDALGLDFQPMARSVVAGVELRPLFLGRFAEDLERGPATLDLWADSWGLGLGIYRLWGADACEDPTTAGEDDRSCPDVGMELSTGFELPLLPRHDGPFVALRLAGRWSLDDGSAAFPSPGPTALATLSLGYRHLFDVHLADAADRLPP